MTLRSSSLIALLLASAALSACTTVGPDYQGPPSVVADAALAKFHRASVAQFTAPATANWWRAYQDPILDRVVERALAGSPSLTAAQARLAQARATSRKQERDRLPTGSVGASYARQQVALAAFGLDIPGFESKPADLFKGEFDASWEADLFGGARRAVQAAHADAQAEAARAADARVSLAAEVVSNYLDLRGAQARLDLSRQAARAGQRHLELLQLRLASGTASNYDIGKDQRQLEVTRAADKSFQAQIDADLDALAVLCGLAPGALDQDLAPTVGLPAAPDALAVGDPGALLRRRPDIRAAERKVAGDVARIGVATADLFPKVSFAGSYSSSATDLSVLGSDSALGFSFGPKLSWNVLNLGRVRADIAKSQARRDESLATYQKTVLAALQDAETSLSRLELQRAYVRGLERAQSATDQTLSLTQARVGAGSASQVDVVEAQQQRLSQLDSLVQAKLVLAKDYAALSKALGFGWEG